MNYDKHKIMDLFCGCGGFGLGAHLAGFESVLAVDIDKTLSSSYTLNFPNSNLVHYDLAKVKSSKLLEVSGATDISGIIGGPPCQGFSTIGRRKKNDPRNELIGHYFRHIKNIQPDFFIMENVPGLLTGPMRDKLDKQLKVIAEQYTIVGPFIVDASRLGAATKRERVIVIGYNSQSVNELSQADIMGLYTDNLITVKDAIWDLSPPADCYNNDYGWAKIDRRRKVSDYALTARQIPLKISVGRLQ